MHRRTACWLVRCSFHRTWGGHPRKLNESLPHGLRIEQSRNAALELNPNFATAVGFVGFALALDGASEAALRQFERALSISPRNPINSFYYGGTAVAHYLSGHFVAAIKWSRQTVQLRPRYLGGYRILCASLAKAGQTAEAAEVAAKLRRLAPEMSIRSIRKSVPYTATTMETFLEGLRMAGLPD